MYMNLVNLGHGNYGFAAAAATTSTRMSTSSTCRKRRRWPGSCGTEHAVPLPSGRPGPRAAGQGAAAMLAEEFIERAQYDAAAATPLRAGTQRRGRPVRTVLRRGRVQISRVDIRHDTVHEGGLQVWTTLDEDMQQAAEKALRDGLLRITTPLARRTGAARGGAATPTPTSSTRWRSQPLAPGRWAAGDRRRADARSARVRVRDQEFEIGPEAIRWNAAAARPSCCRAATWRGSRCSVRRATRRRPRRDRPRRGGAGESRHHAAGAGRGRPLDPPPRPATAAQGAGRGGGAGSGDRRHPRHGRRLGLQRSKFNRVTQAESPGRLRLQAVRLRHRAGDGLHACRYAVRRPTASWVPTRR